MGPSSEADPMANKKASLKGEAKIGKVMKEFKAGSLKSGPHGSGGIVTRKDQAIAIALSEARDAGAKIPVKNT